MKVADLSKDQENPPANRVSILVLLDEGCRPVATEKELKDAEQFQSLFSWMKVADLSILDSNAVTKLVSILVLLDEGCRQVVIETLAQCDVGVSILVLLDEGCRPRPAWPARSMRSRFNPCSLG